MRKYLSYFLIPIAIGIAFVSVFILIFLSQSNDVKFNKVTIPNKFSISIPEYLLKTDSIDSSALLQYKNEKEQMFLLVYEKLDSANTSLESIFKKKSDDFIAKIEHGNLENYYPQKINGIDGFIGNIQGSVNETGVYYRIVVMKAGNSFFEIILGISENMKSSYDEDINQIIQSLSH